MPQRKGLVAPQNTFLDTIATRFDGTHSNFVLGNAQVNEHPIVYCSDGLIELTGYNRSQIMSRCCSCSFLWGDQTTEEARQLITDALEKKTKLQIEVYFHKKNGYAFLCLMDIVPIKNDKDQVVLFLVSHKDITHERQKKGPSCSNVSAHNCPHKIFRNHATKVGHPTTPGLTKPSSFLSAGLATTITAAALGTTAFRKNKLLDYLHANQIQIAQVCPPRPIPVRCPASPIHTDDPNENHLPTRVSRRSHPRSSLSKTDDSVPLTGESPRSSRHSSLTERDSLTSIKDLHTCEKGEADDDDRLSRSDQNAANQTLLVSDSEEQSENTSESDSSDDPSTVYKFQRRRSRAVLYQLSGRFDQKSKRKTPLKRFQRISGKEAIPEYKVQDVQASRFILLHYSLFKIVWDWMILICTFYIAIMVPYNAAFSLDTDGKDLLICDIIVELLFIIDIILNFVTTFVSKSGQVVYHTRAIAINYLRGWFFLDLVAAIPFDVILAVHNRDINGSIGGVGSWIQLLKLARLLRLARLFQKIERYSQYSTVILGLLMCMFFLIAHWFACGWFWIGWADYESSKTREYTT
ncbi:unnamed protein product [Echinostoma caproni]|uniref:PAC domain-containing protein n=1 Tax=Echinostoma caproni TaxID=27848 RepID=A0A183ABS8_9TREM|nr:unnamed protein product [Echinostoma caproni]